MVLGIARLCHGLKRVVLSVLLDEIVHDPLLVGNASSRGIQVHIDAFFFQLCFQFKIRIIGFLFHFHVIADGVGEVHGLQCFFPAVRKRVQFIDERHVVDPACLRSRRDGATLSRLSRVGVFLSSAARRKHQRQS